MEATKKIQNSDLATQTSVRVELECAARAVLPGDVVRAKVTILAGLETMDASGVFIDLLDSEEVALKNSSNERLAHQAMNESFRFTPSFRLAAHEIKTFEGKFRLPINFQPTFAGQFSRHEWQIRARVEMATGDADSGFQKFIIGAGF